MKDLWCMGVCCDSVSSVTDCQVQGHVAALQIQGRGEGMISLWVRLQESAGLTTVWFLVSIVGYLQWLQGLFGILGSGVSGVQRLHTRASSSCMELLVVCACHQLVPI